jgi:hypothetical protein
MLMYKNPYKNPITQGNISQTQKKKHVQVAKIPQNNLSHPLYVLYGKKFLLHFDNTQYIVHNKRVKKVTTKTL